MQPIMPSSKERTGYPTQKPLKLLERIVLASSDEGDVVLDPFCGCATTCVVSHDLNRRWVGIDISPKAAELVVQRIGGDMLRKIIHRDEFRNARTLGSCRRTTVPPTSGSCMGNRTATAPGAASTSRRSISKWTTRATRAGRTTSRTFNCCAATATGSRATAAWTTCGRSCKSPPDFKLTHYPTPGSIVSRATRGRVSGWCGRAHTSAVQGRRP